MSTLPPTSPAREEISFPVLLISPALKFLEVVDLVIVSRALSA